MKRFLTPALAIWATGATVCAAVLYGKWQDSPAPRSTRSTRADVENESLRLPIVELQRKLQEQQIRERHLSRRSGGVTPTGKATDSAEWVARYRKSESGKVRTLAQLTGLARVDPEAHLALLELLVGAEDRGEIDDILIAFPKSWTSGARDADVTQEILQTTRTIARSDASPYRRAAAVEILFGYDRPGKKEYQWGLEALRTETEPLLRRTLVVEISRHCFHLGLTDGEIEPFLDLMHRAAKDGIRCANSLAHWSGRDEDFALMAALAGRKTEADGLVDLLSAFRAGVRLTKGREARSRELLIRVLENSVTPLRARRRALQLLGGYRPWDAVTADAVRRFRAETGPK